MNKLLWFLLPFFFLACQSDSASSGSATSSRPVVTAAEQDSLPDQPASGRSTASEQPGGQAGEKVTPIIGSRPPQQPVGFVADLTLTSDQVTAATGDNVCMKVRVGDFREVITMQYSVAWDPAVLSFTGIRDMSLPYLSNNNFGTHRTGEGILTFVWIDNSLKGVNLPDGSTIYQVCFDVKGTTGQKSAFRITDQPTPFEAVNAEEKLLRIVPGEGEVRVN